MVKNFKWITEFKLISIVVAVLLHISGIMSQKIKSFINDHVVLLSTLKTNHYITFIMHW